MGLIPEDAAAESRAEANDREVVGRALGTECATPLSYWVGLAHGRYLQRDDVVVVHRDLPGREATQLAGIVNLFQTSDLDWTGVPIAGYPSAKWDELPLTLARIEVGSRVNVAQYPLGQDKQISLLFSLVAHVGNNRVQHMTVTEPGSFGSPLFDEAWNVVALHHSGAGGLSQTVASKDDLLPKCRES